MCPSRSWAATRVAHGDRAPRVRRTRRDHAHQDVALLGGRGRAGRAGGAGAGVDAERLTLRGPGEHGGVRRAVPRGGVHQPGTVEVGLLHLAGAPLDQAPAVQVEEHLAQLRRDDHHAGGVGEQRLHAARGHRSATDDEHAAAGQLEPEHRGHEPTSTSPSRDPDRPGAQVRGQVPGRRLAGDVQAAARRQVEHLLVHRGGDRRYLDAVDVPGADDAPRDHVRVAERVVLLDRQHAAVDEPEQGDLVAAEQRGGAALGGEVVEPADRGPHESSPARS